MAKISRRTFLQFSGSTLATLGLSHFDIQRQGIRHAKVLAQNTPRKLALLIGINGYADSPLRGCLTDVDLQRELLIHRFGFNPSDILTVTDQSLIKPTRKNILQAFESHLIDQAKPGDVVVFHFSGHGSQIFDSSTGFSDQLNSTFVPIDRKIRLSEGNQIVSDITGGTLFLLMSALQTDNVTAVLDSCHSGGGKRGNLTIRATQGGLNLRASEAEEEYQNTFLSRLNLSLDDFIKQRQESVAKGIVIASARRDQLAADATFSDISAGAFTYVMTQYLWQLTGNQGLESVIANVSRSTNRLSTNRQIPEFETKKGTNLNQQPAYLLPPSSPPAEGILKSIQGNNVELWLGGIHPKSLDAFNTGAEFTLLNKAEKDLGTIKLTSRQKLVGRGTVTKANDLKALKPGQVFIQEKIRAIPDNYQLIIGLDPSLGNTQALSRAAQSLKQLNRIDIKPIGQGHEIHYILGRMTSSLRSELLNRNFASRDIPPINSIGLYSEGLDLIPGSFRSSNEPISEALGRLKPKFESLLAARIVKLTLNGQAAKLNVSASMHIEGSNNAVLANTFAARGIAKQQQVSLSQPIASTQDVSIKGGIPQLPLDTLLQLQFHNRGQQDLYVTILVIDSGGMTLIFPNNWVASQEDTVVKAGEVRKIPDPNRGDPWILPVSEPLGTTEVLFIASIIPLGESLKYLRNVSGNVRGPVALDDPISAVDLLLQDFEMVTQGQNSRGVRARLRKQRSSTSAMTTLSITFDTVRGDRGPVQLDDLIN